MIEFQVEEFNGPLDLLLALVAKNKMSIYDIEIVTLIDQYLDVLAKNMADDEQSNMMDSTSAFITMAARLVQIKSTLLLPRSEEGERMREELTGLLVEYSACKEVAGKLREMAASVFIAVRKPAQIELDTTYTGQHDGGELQAAYRVIVGRGKMRRPPKAERFDGIVTAPFVSVTGRVIAVLRGLMKGQIHGLRQLFYGAQSRSETVATFLAVLELIRARRVSIDDNEELCVSKQVRKRTREERNGT